jgi:hypothetical protein
VTLQSRSRAFLPINAELQLSGLLRDLAEFL